MVRAGANNPEMTAALGINIKILFRLIFATGACLAGIAGMMLGPLTSVQPGMGEPLLILSLVVIIIGGIGSVRGAFIAAIIVGAAITIVLLDERLLARITAALLAGLEGGMGGIGGWGGSASGGGSGGG